MNEFEKDMLKLIEMHAEADKDFLAGNTRKIIQDRVGRKHNQWLQELCGRPKETVSSWFCKYRKKNKIPLYVLCQIAATLKISVWEFFENEDLEEKENG